MTVDGGEPGVALLRTRGMQALFLIGFLGLVWLTLSIAGRLKAE
ncbi:MAG: hypothetical protein WAM30_08345 [Candidatus Dormiibacterota bacterium]